MDGTRDSVPQPVPGTPGIREMRPEIGSENFGFVAQQNASNMGTSKVTLKAEIDTSPPFGSVKEAVTRFGGSGPWMPYYYRLGENCGPERFDIKKVEEQAAELEKDLIVKELETLDVLEELGTTKKIVEELKLQLQKDALKCVAIPSDRMSSPAIKEMNNENTREQRMGSFSPCPTSSPDLILTELKQAKWNLGKTVNNLGVIQTSVASLNKKMKKEKSFLAKTRERLTSKFAGVLSLEDELKQARVKPIITDTMQSEYKADQLRRMAEVEKREISQTVSANNNQSKANLRNAELRLLAAQKMEEAARAAEAVALAEISALSSYERSSGYILPHPEKLPPFEERSPLTPNAQKPEVLSKKKAEILKLRKHEASFTKMSILKKLREAAEEVKQSKEALEAALRKVEMANRKQFAAEEALRKWLPNDDQDGQPTYYNTTLNNFHFHQPDHHQRCAPNPMQNPSPVVDDPKPVLRSTVSMRDVLSRKPVLPREEYAATRPMEGGTDRQKVALNQMIHELRDDLTFHPRPEKDVGEQKQFLTHRRKFGFIHISLPMTRPNKKKSQDSNNAMH
ncbi:hypothetical protein K2173_023420 [Erythroxylum novogranatense]|uniref:WEB family protein n=1 Tax=Erythroxylum novogranatense TaxID=1862640 RepID=A0AAV8TY26_9ROSI|nr:hypothetical protein K2173_023420 [Erythroxylum novogranatense]